MAAIEQQQHHGRWRPPAGLPRLSGRFLVAYRVLWLLLFVIATAAVAAGIHFREMDYQRRVVPFGEFGLRWNEGRQALALPLGQEGRRAGVETGSRLIAIDGRPIGPGGRTEIADRLRAAGPRVTITTRSPRGEVREHVLTRSPRHLAEAYAEVGFSYGTRRAIEQAIDLLLAATALTASLLLFRRRAREPVAALLSISFLMIVASIATATSAFAHFSLHPLAVMFRFAGWGSLLATMAVFPEGRLQPRWSLAVVLLAALWALAGGFDAITPTQLAPAEVYNLGALAIVVATAVAMASRYRSYSAGIERQQIRWAALGWVLGAALGAASLLFLSLMPFAPDNRSLVWLGLAAVALRLAGSICFVVGLVVSLLRFRLYDVDTVASRSAGFAVLTLLLGFIFAASAQAIEALFELRFGGDAGAWPGAIGAGLAVVLFTPLQRRVHAWAERRFQKDLIALRRELPESVADLRETDSLKVLLEDVLSRVTAGVHARAAAVQVGGRVEAARGVSLAEARTWAKRAANADPPDVSDSLFPLRVPLTVRHGAAEPVGWLLLGPRPDGSLYGRDERDTLAEIADPVARAIRIVLAREAREARYEARFRKLEQGLQPA
ncbi:MAG: hypothetical protein ACT4OE_00070 [Sphingosinicella sp.]